MKFAFFSPLNPQKSGIADYSEELLPYLVERAEIDIFIDTDVTPTTKEIVENFSIYSFTQFEQCHQQTPYDLCLYQMGNNTAYHRYMDAVIQTYPGVVTLHDYVLHHFYAEMFAEEERYDEYQFAMESYYGELGKKIAEKFRQGIRSDYVNYQLPFYQRVVNPSLGTIVHSSYLKTKLLQHDPSRRVEMIPMGIRPPDLDHYVLEELRIKHHIPQGAFVIASFGFIIQDKRIRELLRTFSQFVKDVPDALCLLVGKETPVFDVRKILRDLQLEDNVIITGYTSYDEFLEYIALSDVCVNLRYPTVRATSANILKIMGFAKPVITSDLCEFLDIPTTCCLKIPLNETEEETLLQAFFTLHDDYEHRRALGKRARTYIEEFHPMQQAADKYIAFCSEIVNKRSSKQG
jgi:glycosyltransferase involved in cell wall biosynthesis